MVHALPYVWKFSCRDLSNSNLHGPISNNFTLFMALEYLYVYVVGSFCLQERHILYFNVFHSLKWYISMVWPLTKSQLHMHDMHCSLPLIWGLVHYDLSLLCYILYMDQSMIGWCGVIYKSCHTVIQSSSLYNLFHIEFDAEAGVSVHSILPNNNIYL